MMKCPVCGSDNQDDFEFCSTCGNRLIRTSQFSKPIETYLDRSRKRRSMHIVMAIVGVVVLLAMLVYIFAMVYVMGGTLVITIDPVVDKEVHYKLYIWDRLEREGNLSADGIVVLTYDITWKIWANDTSVNVNVMLTADDWQGSNQTQWVTMSLGARKYLTFSD